jgi:hypothetical protein
MKIQRAEFLGIAGVPDLSIDLRASASGAPPNVVVVSGRSGAGKTRLLEALVAAKEAIRPYGAMATGAAWIRASGAAKVRLSFHLDEDEREFAGTSSSSLDAEVVFHPKRVEAEADDGLRAVLGRYTHSASHGKVDYFPAERRVPTFPPFGSLAPAEQRIGRLTKDARKYGFVLPYLRSLDHDGPRRERFVAGLESLSATCRYVRDPSEQVIAQCFTSRGGNPVTLSELSQGEADSVLFAATSSALGLDHSLVLIDRPDLYADEPDRFVEGLAALGVDNQLWLACPPRVASTLRGAALISLSS